MKSQKNWFSNNSFSGLSSFSVSTPLPFNEITATLSANVIVIVATLSPFVFGWNFTNNLPPVEESASFVSVLTIKSLLSWPSNTGIIFSPLKLVTVMSADFSSEVLFKTIEPKLSSAGSTVIFIGSLFSLVVTFLSLKAV